MKIILLLVVIAYSQAFLFDDLFGSHCKTDADCRSGCCMTDVFGDNACVDKYLHYLQECRLDGNEHHSCGCGQGLYCETYANIHGAAVETPHSGASGYGLCERNTTTTA